MTWFQSRRSALTARRGAVATSQPIAAQCGLRVLMDGGHAVDAAVATAAALAVVEPHMTGLGGDLFALVWDARRYEVTALNASGRTGASANIDAVRAAGFDAIPSHGAGAGLAVSVPGTAGGWAGPAGTPWPHGSCGRAGAGHRARPRRLRSLGSDRSHLAGRGLEARRPASRPGAAARRPRAAVRRGHAPSHPRADPANTRRGRTPRLLRRADRGTGRGLRTDARRVPDHRGSRRASLRLGRSHLYELPRGHRLGVPAECAGNRGVDRPQRRGGLRHRRDGGAERRVVSPPDRSDAAGLRRHVAVRRGSPQGSGARRGTPLQALRGRAPARETRSHRASAPTRPSSRRSPPAAGSSG